LRVPASLAVTLLGAGSSSSRRGSHIEKMEKMG
jgi:hypothetical protein